MSKLILQLLLGATLVLAFVHADQRQHERQREHEKIERQHLEHGEKSHQMRRDKKEEWDKLNDFERERLLKVKDELLLFRKLVETYQKDPLPVQEDRKCFEKIKSGQSLDIVIDIAPSPTMDKLDKLSADSPVALFWQRVYHTPSRAYFGSIQLFIESLSLDIKSECVHSVIFDHHKRSKLFLRGQTCEDIKKMEHNLFEDKNRGLSTLWPHCTKEVHSALSPIVKNNLGRMTKLALWNRDNGLPTVFSTSRDSKPFFTVVVTDGASGAKIEDLTDDLSRTFVIDIGNKRFVDRLDWDHFRRLPGTFVLTAPQHLSLLTGTVRNMACRILENVDVKE